MDKSTFLEKEYDKFHDSTNTNFKYPESLDNRYLNTFRISHDGYSCFGMGLNLDIRHFKSPENEQFIIDFFVQSETWYMLGHGQLMINLDSVETIKLDAIQTSTEVDEPAVCYETGMYYINEGELKKIFEADEISVRFTGQDVVSLDLTNNTEGHKVNKNLKPLDKFHFMIRAFYSSYFDDNSQDEYLSKTLEHANKNIGMKNSGPNNGCFIATASYGNYNHPVVIDLRVFRDKYLLNNVSGAKFVGWYYKEGPKYAGMISKSSFMKACARIFLIKPIHFIVKTIFDLGN